MATRQETVLRGTPPLLLAQLGLVSAQDRVVESRRRLTAWLGWLLLIAGFVILFSGSPIGLVLLVAAIVVFIVWRGYRSADLDNDRLQLVQGLISIIQDDLSETTPAELTLRHGSCVQYGTASNQRTEGSWATGRVQLSEHEDTWLNFKARLRDKSSLQLTVTELDKRKAKPKRKYTKTMDRIREKIALTVRVPTDRYPHLERLQEALRTDQLQTHAGLTVTGIRTEPPSVVRLGAISGEFIRRTLRSGTSLVGQENQLTADKLASLMLLVYAGLSRCGADGAATK